MPSAASLRGFGAPIIVNDVSLYPLVLGLALGLSYFLMSPAGQQPDPRFSEIKELSEVCKQGNIARARDLLQLHPDALNSPDYDTRFSYPESCLWSPLGLAARHGHVELVHFLLAAGANPVPFEFAAQYHQHLYEDWTKELRERGYTRRSKPSKPPSTGTTVLR